MENPAGPSFRDRTRQFVRALEAAAQAIQAACARRAPRDVFDVVCSVVEQLSPELAWTLCPGRNGAHDALALSPEGDRELRLLTGWVTEHHPVVGGIEVLPAKTANPDADAWSLEIDDHELSAADFRVDARVDAAHGAVDVRLFHPVFPSCGEHVRGWVSMVWLDEALGEDLVMRGIGVVQPTTDPAGLAAVGAAELRARVRALVQEIGADPDAPPAATWSTVRIPDEVARDGRFRADARFGSSRFPKLCEPWLDAAARDPLAAHGAGFAALGFPLDRLEEGHAVEQRGEVEEAIDDALRRAHAGEVLGGYFGVDRAYIDLFAVDRGAADDAVRAALAGCARVATAELRWLGARDVGIPMK